MDETSAGHCVNDWHCLLVGSGGTIDVASLYCCLNPFQLSSKTRSVAHVSRACLVCLFGSLARLSAVCQLVVRSSLCGRDLAVRIIRYSSNSVYSNV